MHGVYNLGISDPYFCNGSERPWLKYVEDRTADREPEMRLHTISLSRSSSYMIPTTLPAVLVRTEIMLHSSNKDFAIILKMNNQVQYRSERKEKIGI